MCQADERVDNKANYKSTDKNVPKKYATKKIRFIKKILQIQNDNRRGVVSRVVDGR